jgi:tRNA threonylcarbamoyladenosine biosynthesis protein TsaB
MCICWVDAPSLGRQAEAMSASEPCLVLDGSARAGVRVGVLSGGRWVGQGISPDGALEGLFGCVEKALADAKLPLADIRSFALCVGPGSVLGIRIAALAVRSWSALAPRPIFVWESLAALARSALVAGEQGPFLVAVESRLKRWHALEVSADGTLGAPFEAEAAQLNSSGRRVLASSEAAPGVLTPHVAVPPPWSSLPTFFTQQGFLREEPRPDALNVANDFATWSGERHRA